MIKLQLQYLSTTNTTVETPIHALNQLPGKQFIDGTFVGYFFDNDVTIKFLVCSRKENRK